MPRVGGITPVFKHSAVLMSAPIPEQLIRKK